MDSAALAASPVSGALFSNMNIELKKWMVPIFFEGIELSPISIAIDQLGMHHNLPQISEEASKWLWRFTICRGVNKNDQGETVFKHVSETLFLTKKTREDLLVRVPHTFDGDFTETHLDMWINDLETILEACKDKEMCCWTAQE